MLKLVEMTNYISQHDCVNRQHSSEFIDGFNNYADINEIKWLQLLPYIFPQITIHQMRNYK